MLYFDDLEMLNALYDSSQVSHACKENVRQALSSANSREEVDSVMNEVRRTLRYHLQHDSLYSRLAA